jgi:hypothetical protein
MNPTANDNSPFTAESVRALIEDTFGISAEEYGKLTIQQQAQLAYDRGLAFAGNVNVTAYDGTVITSQEQKVFRLPTPPTVAEGE